MNEATSQVRKVWDDQAKVWYAQREALLAASRPVHEWLVRHIDPKPGQRLLEIAAGPGDTGFMAAPLLKGGRLVSTDLAPAMVEAARNRGAELGITNADYRVLDAQAMDLDDQTFDAAVCRWGFMLMPDPAAAFREAWRVLKPGGRLVFSVFAGPAENPWVSIPVGVLREAGRLPQASANWQPGILALADRARLQALLDGAGFASTDVEAVGMSWTFANADEYWTFLEQTTALGPAFRALDDAARADVRAAIDARTAKYMTADLALPALCWCGVAMKN